MWSMGCIFAELFLKDTLFRGEDENSQTMLIFNVLGSKKEEDLAGYNKLKGYNNRFRNITGIGLKSYLETKLKNSIDLDALDLMGRMLAIDPSKRISAKEALDHKFFRNLNEQTLN